MKRSSEIVDFLYTYILCFFSETPHFSRRYLFNFKGFKGYLPMAPASLFEKKKRTRDVIFGDILWHWERGGRGQFLYIIPRLFSCGTRNDGRKRIGSRLGRTLRWIDSSRKWAICSLVFFFLCVTTFFFFFLSYLRRVTNCLETDIPHVNSIDFFFLLSWWSRWTAQLSR